MYLDSALGQKVIRSLLRFVCENTSARFEIENRCSYLISYAQPEDCGHFALAATYRDLGQVLHSQLPVLLRRETPAQYPCSDVSASE